MVIRLLVRTIAWLKFCKHSCSFNPLFICYILPCSFNKPFIQQRAFTNNYQLIHTQPYNEFYASNNTQSTKYNIPCIFQIWKRYEDVVDRIYNESNINMYFDYVNKTEINNISKQIYSIRRVGSKTPELTSGVHPSNQDHFYIIFHNDIIINRFITEYNKIVFDFNDCGYQRNINKKKLNYIVNRYIDYNKVSVYYKFTKEDEIIYNTFNKQIDDDINTNISDKAIQSYNELIYTIQTNLKINYDITTLLPLSSLSKWIISPQYKASKRGALLNKIVLDKIYNMFNSIDNIIINKEVDNNIIGEKADAYIKYNNKELFIYNQIGLWNGGEQLNRGDKYINKLKESNTIYVVIAPPPTQTIKETKANRIVLNGRTNNNLIWLSELETYINNYFELNGEIIT